MRDELRGIKLLVSSLALAVSSLACGPSSSALCSAKCDCEGCSQGEFNGCVAEHDGEIKDANFRGCVLEYDDYLSCQNATGFCKGTHFETSCGLEKDRWKHCVDDKKHK